MQHPLEIDDELSDDVVIATHLRRDAWTNDEWARAGVGRCGEPETKHGLNLVVHQGQLQFVQDYVA